MNQYTENTENLPTQNDKQMTTITCPYCNKKIPGKSTECPHCGLRLREAPLGEPVDLNNRKNIIKTIVRLLFAVIFIGAIVYINAKK